MTPITVNTIQVEAKRWISAAINQSNGKLVACSMSTTTEHAAEMQVKDTLRRFRRTSETESVRLADAIKSVIQRLWELVQGMGKPFILEEISTKNWSKPRLKISNELLKIPRGKVISYGGLAKRAHSSPRGVGSVMASNPVPCAIPCHRVIHSDGQLGKYGRTTSGSRVKAAILRAEGIPFLKGERVHSRAIVV